MPNTSEIGYCVIIGKEEYCNITKPWTPRFSDLEVTLTVILPVLYSVAMLLIFVLCQNNCRFGQLFRQIKVTFISNKKAIYFKDIYGKEKYTKIIEMSKEERLFEIKKMQSRRGALITEKEFQELEDEEQIEHLKSRELHHNPEQLTREERLTYRKLGGLGKNINADMIKKYRSMCGAKIPDCVRLVVMTTMVILVPILKAGWDIVDVGADCFYFNKLETGGLINPNITRNTSVNNTILMFAVIGALKSPVIALISMRLIEYSYGARRDSVGMCAFLKCFMVWIKIMFEDGAELFLEYFYGDKFITSKPPWWLIIKDSVTSLIYLSPLLNSFFSLKKKYKKVHDQLGAVEAAYIFLPCTLVHFLFCAITLLRVAGMTWQYLKADVSRGCLAVSQTTGTLYQTPFNADCINPVDGFILFLGSIALVFALVSFFNFFRSRMTRKLAHSFVFRRVFVKSKVFKTLASERVISYISESQEEVNCGTSTAV
ncbi:hypothetical protein ACHWQZ_G001279 [Mnemiopsis leidyi]